MSARGNSKGIFLWWDRVDQSLCRIEGVVLVISLMVMVAMTFTQVLLRNLFDQGVLWFDPFVRHLVIWIGFLGAAVATRERKHVNVDALSRFVKGRWKHLVNIVISAFGASVCFFLFLASIQFVKNSFALGERIHQVFPTWIAQVVFPYALGIMCLRFFHDFILSCVIASKGETPLVLMGEMQPAEDEAS